MKKDSNQLAGLLTNDSRLVSTRHGIGKQEAFDWTAAGNPTATDNSEVLYENDEVAVIYHNADNPNNNGVVMTFGTKKDGKFSLWRVVRQVV